jgi:hypothetical protein
MPLRQGTLKCLGTYRFSKEVLDGYGFLTKQKEGVSQESLMIRILDKYWSKVFIEHCINCRGYFLEHE